MDYYIISYIIVSAVPGLWLAAQKNFLVIPNRNYDIFPVRFLFMAPLVFCVLLLSGSSDLIIGIAFPELYQTLPERFGIYIGLLEPLCVSLVTIPAVRLFILRKDMPPEKDPDFMNCDLYVYQPKAKIQTFGISKQNCLDADTFSVGDIYMNTKAGDHFTEKEAIKRSDILLTNRGEMIASPRAVDLFSAYGLTGFGASPISIKGLGGDEKFYGPFYRIRSLHKMPHMAPPTVVRKRSLINTEVWIVDDLIYYDPDAISSADDFNESLEDIGSTEGFPYWPQPLQIVSNRVMKLFIDEFGQHRGDFIPVHCNDDAGPKRKTDPSTKKL